jgi:flagellin
MALNAARNLAGSFSALGVSTRRLSSGLRISVAADDPAGLAVSELMRSDISALNQGIRNANDAISMIQIADGALQVIDEKLIRMKELAVQAATGTYNSDQRQIIHSEWVAMRSEIERIAQATDFNGIKLLNDFRDIKIHFGTGNDSKEDYYYVNRQYATVDSAGLGLDLDYGSIQLIYELFANGETKAGETSGIVSYAVIPRGAVNVQIHTDDRGWDDTIQLFTRRGFHVAGTEISDVPWAINGINNTADMNSQVLTEGNGFRADAEYVGTELNGIGGSFDAADFNTTAPYNTFEYNNMTIGYSGNGNPNPGAPGSAGILQEEWLTINETSEDLVLLVVGNGAFDVDVSWDSMPNLGQSSLSTQALAQETLRTMDEAILRKDKIRAQLGATQNRLQNTITNLEVQAENLQASESRIRDVDVSREMTEFTRTQILSQASVAMLAQANSLPRIALQLLL